MKLSSLQKTILALAKVVLTHLDRTHWRLSVHDLNTETGEPEPWAVTLSFDFNRTI